MVSFSLTDDQKMIQDMLRDFAARELRAAARKSDEEGIIPDGLEKKSVELCLVRNVLPEEFGGFGEARSALTGAIMAEELAWGDLSLALHICSPSLGAFPILDMGTDEQKKKFLPQFCADSFAAGSVAVVEPKMDFDFSDLSVKARKDGGDYVLNGKKCFVPLASRAEQILVCAAVEDGKTGYDAGAVFIVPRDAAGLEIGEREKNMGLKALETYEVSLTDCKAAGDAMLGGERGCDFRRLAGCVRTGIAAMAVGVARAAFEYARDYAKERVQFGEPIASRQAIAFMIAEMGIEIDAARMLVWEAAWKMDRGEDALKESYLAKRYAADMVMKVTDRAVQALGGHGYIREHPVEMWFRNGRGFAMIEGLAMV